MNREEEKRRNKKKEELKKQERRKKEQEGERRKRKFKELKRGKTANSGLKMLNYLVLLSCSVHFFA